TPRPDDDCVELMGEAYKAGYRDGYNYGIAMCRKHHREWFKKLATPKTSASKKSSAKRGAKKPKKP
ncbi:MAG TPA: hypothetical protein VMT52_16965, partial [Planctomycetota bacterium]|nr:hypothetical protein [Planctomycetota bacterium]